MSFEARLCREIVEEDFGCFASNVVSQLLLKGRLTLGDLVRFTKLTQRQVRSSLVIMIQHGFVFFNEPNEGERGPTFYQADPVLISMRLRIGAILRVTEEEYGTEAATVCKLMFTYGRLRIENVREWVRENDSKSKNRVNEYTKAFTELASAGFIKAVLPEHSRSTTDRYLDAREKESQKYTIMTAKDMAAVKAAAQAQVDAEYTLSETLGMKRKAVDPMGAAYKRAAVDTVVEIDESYFFAINYEKFNMTFRNNAIVEYATERINRSAGDVVKAFLDFGRDKMKRLDEEESPSASPIHIGNIIPSEVLARHDIALPPDPVEPNRRPSPQEIVKAYIMLLRTDQAGFIRNADERGANQYAVNFAKLRDTMKRRIFEGLLREKYGVATCRLVRILLDKGKLDEGQLTKLAMLPAKETREKLGFLNQAGVVEIQEIPKTADRAPGRTFYLWYVPLDKCYHELLVETYRAIGNLQQRKREELKIRNRLLDKLNREDVMNDMSLLGPADQEELKLMEKVLLRIETSKKRLDEMIMILRDF